MIAMLPITLAIMPSIVTTTATVFILLPIRSNIAIRSFLIWIVFLCAHYLNWHYTTIIIESQANNKDVIL